jgi:death-on-curing protein
MKYLSLDEVYAIHQRMIKIGGGRGDIHDFSLLHSAIERARVTFAGHELYPTIWDKATALIQSLIKNHPFDDGNKRTAYYATKRFFYINDYELNAINDDIIQFTVFIDVHNLTKKDISLWLQSHCVKIK